MFMPVFEEALTADPVDTDLLGRCCAFGFDLTRLVLPYAGPLFTEALRDCGWVG